MIGQESLLVTLVRLVDRAVAKSPSHIKNTFHRYDGDAASVIHRKGVS